MSKKSRYEKMHSDKGLTLKTEEGEPITVKINEKGTILLKSSLVSDNSGIGIFEITGLSAKKAASKKKGFWGSLWGKIKKLAGDVLDAVTVPVFGYSCRPDISIDIKNGGVSFGISCTEIV